MATKQLYATGEFRYGTRRLKAGDPVEMIGPHQRLYLHLGKVTEEKPKKVDTDYVASADASEAETFKASKVSEAKKIAPRKRRAKKLA
jgi:hypothetical protein